MAKVTKSLRDWCVENNKTNILSELDFDKNSQRFSIGYIPDRIEFNSSYIIDWKCENGHSYSCEVVGRTLFDLKCPICYPNGNVLPVGTKYGCLTIIGDYNDYKIEVVEPKIQKVQKEKDDFIKGIRKCNSNIDSVDFFDRRIENIQSLKLYKCRCKCGKVHYRNQNSFLKSKHKYCTPNVTENGLEYYCRESKSHSEEDALKHYCGLAAKKWIEKNKKSKRVFATNYDVDFTGKTYESLEILECIDDKYEERHRNNDLRKKDAYIYYVYKIYKCRCHLCGEEYEVKCSEFSINPPTPYGSTAYNGYWSKIKCDCHKISSFQWIVNKLLFENNVPYMAEYSFSDLFGIYGKNKLRFDFAIFNEDGSLKCLIECQGEQHFGPVAEFGGEVQHNIQVQNDELKEEYIKKHNIELLEISYKDKQIEKIETILRNHNII